MAYRYDNDLEFLKSLSSTELNDLVYILTHDKDGEKRLTENLTFSDKYKRFYPDHTQYWDEIATFRRKYLDEFAKRQQRCVI